MTSGLVLEISGGNMEDTSSLITFNALVEALPVTSVTILKTLPAMASTVDGVVEVV